MEDTVVCKECGKSWKRGNRKGFICWACFSRRRRAKHNCSVCGAVMRSENGTLCRACWDASKGDRPQEMEKNGNWKGGTTKHSRGYILRKQPDHPRAHNGYVFDHILVVEAMIGRHLSPKETVHHKNGNTSDNRPENLELWASGHRPGQRVDDLIEYAVEILTKYAPERLK